MTDPIADMLTRIRNAQMVKKSVVVMPYSKLKENILTLLVEQGWLASVKKIASTDRFASLQVKLQYVAVGQPKINSLKRISKPGRRVYAGKDNIPHVLNGRGVAIISTSQGLLTDNMARKAKLGGEVICEIY